MYKPSALRTFRSLYLHSRRGQHPDGQRARWGVPLSRRRLVLRLRNLRGFLHASCLSGICFSGTHPPSWSSRVPKRGTFTLVKGRMYLGDNWQKEAVKFALLRDGSNEADKLLEHGSHAALPIKVIKVANLMHLSERMCRVRVKQVLCM